MSAFKRAAAFFVVASSVFALSGCITVHSYVDQSLGDPHYGDLKKAESPQPIQLLFEFQSKGVSNSRVTESVRSKIYEQVSQSGLFSKLSYDPVPSGRKLSILINNVPLTSNAAAKGFATGLTFGLAGSTVADGYVCTISYIEPGHDIVTRKVNHAIVSTIGNTAGPSGLQAMTTVQAVDKMLRQIVAKGLEEIDNASDLAQ
jgi:hypothetical protein